LLEKSKSIFEIVAALSVWENINEMAAHATL
jgi:hypothetical protein